MNGLNLTPEQVNALFPVVGAELFRGGLVVKRVNTAPWIAGRTVKQARGDIACLTKRSMARLAFLTNCNKDVLTSLMTMTYGINYPLSGRQVKSDLNLMLTRMRQRYGNFSYIWFLEFQKRGAPHIHLVLSLPGPGEVERQWFAKAWASIATGGLNIPYSQVEYYRGRFRARGELYTQDAVVYKHLQEDSWSGSRSKDGCARYVLKYATKAYQKNVPTHYRNVGRFWGNSRDLGVRDGEIVVGSEAEVREFLALKGRDFGSYEVLPKICFY